MIERFKNIFYGLDRAHGVTVVGESNGDGNKIKGKSFVKREPVTDELWQKHLDGADSLGIIPINDDNKCKWGCIDIDSYAEFDHKKLINKIKQFQLPLVVCRSKSGGAHVFLFTEDYVSAGLMQDKLNEIRSVLGYGGSEVFPKQRELKSKDDTGNFLNLPYFNCGQTTRYAFMEDGEAASIDAFFELYERYKQQDISTIEIKRPESEFDDGPPCIESLTQDKLEDGRDRVIYQYIIYAKMKWPENWQDKIFEFNYKHFKTPLDQKIITAKIKNNEKNDFHYKCSEEPMCNVCDKKLCKKRKFGIGQEPIFPGLTDLQVVNLEEPYYYMNVDGDRLYLDSAKHLANQALFQEECIKQLRINPPTLKTGDWKKITTMLLNGAEITEPAEGTGTKDILNNYLEDYCVNRIQKDDYEDLRNGGTYTKDGFHHFVFDNFFNNYLSRKHWRVPYQRTSQMLKDDLNCTTKRVGKTKLSVFVVARFDKKTETYKPKTFKKENY
jgi:hypothetical protein